MAAKVSLCRRFFLTKKQGYESIEVFRYFCNRGSGFSCRKEEISPSGEESTFITKPSELQVAQKAIFSNPYDAKMRHVLDIYAEWNQGNYSFHSFEAFADSISHFFYRRMQYYGIPVMATSVNSFSDYEVSYLIEIVNILNEGNEVFQNIANVEQSVLSDENLSDEKKEVILYFASFMKYHYEGLTQVGISYNGRRYYSWEHCMIRVHQQLFSDDGNPVPEIEYIFGLPWSFFWKVAYCACEMLC